MKCNVIVGYIETKKIESDLNSKSKVYREQLERYSKLGLDNFIVTNFLDFKFYQNGKPLGESVEIARIEEDGDIVPLHGNFEKFKKYLDGFIHGEQREKMYGDLSEVELAKLLLQKIKNIDDNKVLKSHLEEFIERLDKKSSFVVEEINRNGEKNKKEMISSNASYENQEQEKECNAQIEEMFNVEELFKSHRKGIVTGRSDIAYQFTKKEMKEVMDDFANLDIEQARVKYNLDLDGNWTVKGAQEDLKRTGLDENNIHSVTYKPFDERYTYYTGNRNGFHSFPSANIMCNFINRKNLALVFDEGAEKTRGVFITDKICNFNVFPLYLYSSNSRKPNLEKEIIDNMATKLKLEFISERREERNAFSALDVLDYIYAVLYSSRYQRKLKTNSYKIIPYPENTEQFWELIKLGKELRQLHLLKSDRLGTLKINYYSLKGSNKVSGVKYDDNEGKIYINEYQYFDIITPQIWNFKIGVYSPLQRWLKKREGRELSNDDITHFEKMVNALYLTSKIKASINKILI